MRVGIDATNVGEFAFDFVVRQAGGEAEVLKNPTDTERVLALKGDFKTFAEAWPKLQEVRRRLIGHLPRPLNVRVSINGEWFIGIEVWAMRLEVALAASEELARLNAANKQIMSKM